MATQNIYAARDMKIGRLAVKRGTKLGTIDGRSITATHTGVDRGQINARLQRGLLHVGPTPPTPPAKSAEDEGDGGTGVNASPKAAQLAAEHDLDLTTIEGTGKNGAITVDDVKRVIEAL